MQLFYLVANSYQSQCKGVELLKQRGRDICWTFISDHAPLHLKLKESVKQRICKSSVCSYVGVTEMLIVPTHSLSLSVSLS